MAAEDERFLQTRQSLLLRLRELDDWASWQAFFDLYWKLIYRAAQTAGLNPSECEEVVQETIIILAKKMPHFEYVPREEGGSFKRWLLKQTKWRIADQFRKRGKDRFLVSNSTRDPVSDESVQEIADPSARSLDEQWDAEWEQNLLDAALERVKRRVDPRHYQVFHLRAIKKWPAWRVATAMKVSITRVYVIKHRVTKEFENALKEVRKPGD